MSTVLPKRSPNWFLKAPGGGVPAYWKSLHYMVERVNKDWIWTLYASEPAKGNRVMTPTMAPAPAQNPAVTMRSRTLEEGIGGPSSIRP